MKTAAHSLSGADQVLVARRAAALVSLRDIAREIAAPLDVTRRTALRLGWPDADALTRSADIIEKGAALDAKRKSPPRCAVTGCRRVARTGRLCTPCATEPESAVKLTGGRWVQRGMVRKWVSAA